MGCCYPYGCCYPSACCFSACCYPSCCYPSCCYYPCCYPCYREMKENETQALVKVKIYDTLEETAYRSKLKRQCLVYRQTCENCKTFVPLARINQFYDTETTEGVKDIPDEDHYYKTSHFKAINYFKNVSLKEMMNDKNFPPHFLKKYYDPPYPFWMGFTNLVYDVFYFECRLDRSLDATVDILETYIHLVDNCFDTPLLRLFDSICSKLTQQTNDITVANRPKQSTKKPSKILEDRILLLIPLDLPSLVVGIIPIPQTLSRDVIIDCSGQSNSIRENEDVDEVGVQKREEIINVKRAEDKNNPKEDAAQDELDASEKEDRN